MSDEIDRIVERLLSRRTFVQRMCAAGFAVSGASAFLAACGGIEGENQGDGADATPTPQAVNHPKVDFTQVNFANWPLYIDKKVLNDFEKQFGARGK